MSELKDALERGLTSVLKEYTQAKQRSRGPRLTQREAQWLRTLNKNKEKDEIKAAAYAAMPEAYKLASANGTLPANARQVMYQARPIVLAAIGKCWKDSGYFTQTLLPDYQSDFPNQTADWDVVYDARGHFAEPHVRQKLGVGTLEVRTYVKSWGVVDPTLNIEVDELYPTTGPENRYQFALFIEKEGFDPLLNRSQIAKKYDLAIFSSKGQSVTATRELVDHLSQEGVTILIVHDFDIYGLSIAHNLGHDTRRYKFEVEPNMIDLGLRLSDVKDMGLLSEPVDYGKQEKDPGERLLDYDEVSVEEIKFLVDGGGPGAWTGKRVELNAMTSTQFITWLEAKLKEHGVKKVMPDEETLAAAWQRADQISRIQEAIAEIEGEVEDEIPVPQNLKTKIRKLLKQEPELSWDQALVRIAKETKVKK